MKTGQDSNFFYTLVYGLSLLIRGFTDRLINLIPLSMKIPRLLILLAMMLTLQNCTGDRKSFTIYTIGDSTMADKAPEAFPETGWCQGLSSYFGPGVTVRNHAVNGRSTKSFIDEGRWKAVADSLKPGDYVFIQFGHNDEKDYDTTRYTTPFGSYKANLVRFVNETRSRGATPVLFTSIVRRNFNDEGILVATHGDYPAAVRMVADSLNVAFIDHEKLTGDWVISLGDEASREYFVWTSPDDHYPEGRRDNTHLSQKGADAVARLALGEALRKKLPFAGSIIREKI